MRTIGQLKPVNTTILTGMEINSINEKNFLHYQKYTLKITFLLQRNKYPHSLQLKNGAT